MGIIIATVIGCGKTHLIKDYESVMSINDMTPVTKEPDEIAEEASNQAANYDITFVRGDLKIVEAICDKGVDFDLFYPSKEKVNEIVEGLVLKRLDFKAIQKFDNNVPKLIDQLDSIDDPHCFKHKLERGQYLCTDEMLYKYLESFTKK